MLMTPDFGGPDATSYLSFVRAAQFSEYWFDPAAFEGNFFPMGYPAVLAGFYALAGGSTIAYQGASVLMGLGVTAMVYGLLDGFAREVRLAAAAAVAVCPSVLWMMQNNGYEMLLAFLLTSSVFIVSRQRSVASHKAYFALALAGLAFGAGTLVQSKILVVLPVLLYLLRGSWRSMTPFLVGAVALPAAWALRNLVVLQTPYPFSTNGGMGLWLGNNPFTVDGGVVASMPPKPPGTSSLAEAALQFVISQPEAAFTLVGRRIARLLSPTYLYREEWFPEFNVVYHGFSIAFVTVGVLLFAAYVLGRLWVAPPEIPPVGVFAAVVLAFFVAHFPFQSEPRYMTPIVPLALVVAVPTAFSLARASHRRVPSWKEKRDSFGIARGG